MFPNSPSSRLLLLKVSSTTDGIGNKKMTVAESREVVAIERSVTASEHSSSVAIGRKVDRVALIQSFLYEGQKYAKIGGSLYKVERTYLSGQFIELHLGDADITLG